MEQGMFWWGLAAGVVVASAAWIAYLTWWVSGTEGGGVDGTE
jgi:hypothetical protein